MINDSVGNYLRKRRLTVAAERLLNSNENILDIALEFQFGSHEAFTRSFKSAFGIGPNEFRKQKKTISLYRKPKLSEDLLFHINFGMQKQPEIVKMPALHLVGSEIVIKSPLAYDDFVDELPVHWIEFLKHTTDIKNRNCENFYGVAADKDIESESISYLAAVDTQKADFDKSDFTVLEIPAAEYAVFENRGLADKTHNTIDYIYGYWLPNSDYKRVDLYDFEVFDQRYKIGDLNSISSYYVPISKK